jgi:cell division protein FtsN
MFAGLLIGLVVGLVLAAGLAWYFNFGSGGFKAADSAPGPVAKPASTPVKPGPMRPEAGQNKAPEAPPPVPEADTPAPAMAKPDSARSEPDKATAEPTRGSPAAKPRVDYTFYGILPGDKPAKPVDPPKSNETWWLQVAALKNPADADKLKARLSLLGLQVSTQRVESGGQALFRIRVGPYKREDDALGDLDTLAQNNFEPRLFKEPVKP